MNIRYTELLANPHAVLQKMERDIYYDVSITITAIGIRYLIFRLSVFDQEKDNEDDFLKIDLHDNLEFKPILHLEHALPESLSSGLLGLIVTIENESKWVKVGNRKRFRPKKIFVVSRKNIFT